MSALDMEDLIKRTVLAEVRLSAEAANMPQGFIDAIHIEKISDTEYQIVNDWSKTDDEGNPVPLAKFFEYGTQDFYLTPRSPDGVLAWPSGGPESGRPKAIYSKRADNPKGQVLFSKGHWISGQPALEPMHRGFRIGLQRLKEAIQK